MMQFAPSSCTGNKPLWSEDHNGDQNDAEDQITNIAEGETRNNLGNSPIDGVQETGRVSSNTIKSCEHKLVDCIDNECPNNHTGNASNTTNDHHREVKHRVTKAKVIRRNSTKLCRMISPG